MGSIVGELIFFINFMIKLLDGWKKKKKQRGIPTCSSALDVINGAILNVILCTEVNSPFYTCSVIIDPQLNTKPSYDARKR